MSSKNKKRRKGKSRVTARLPYLKLKMNNFLLMKNKNKQNFNLKRKIARAKTNKSMNHLVKKSIIKNPWTEMREFSTVQNITCLKYA